MLLWKMILAAAALKGRKACAQPADARVREIGKQALSGPFAGMEASLVEKTNGWGFFTVGHHAMPYAASAAEAPVSEYAGCHMANVAKTDMTWVQFYPLLRDK